MRSVARAAKRLRRWWEETGSRREAVDPAEQIAQKQWAEGIWARVASLSIEHQQALLLRYGEGLSYDEMAEIVGTPVGTARTRVHYALEKLRGSMKPGSSLSFEPTTDPL
jgi:RNA polymerase sigma-70 factor (ECF subfamily)